MHAAPSSLPLSTIRYAAELGGKGITAQGWRVTRQYLSRLQKVTHVSGTINGSVSHGLYMKPNGVLRFGERGQNGFSWFGYCALLSPVQQLPRSKVCLLSAYQPSSDAGDLSSLATALPPLLWVRLLQASAPSKRSFDHDARASWVDSDCEPGYRMSKLRSDRRR